MRLPWVNLAALGMPVVPPVYCSTARSRVPAEAGCPDGMFQHFGKSRVRLRSKPVDRPSACFEGIEPGKGPGESLRQTGNDDLGQINLGTNLFQPGQEVVQEHQVLGPGVRQLMGQFFGAEEGIEHHRHCTQAQGGVVGHHSWGQLGRKMPRRSPGARSRFFRALARPAVWVLSSP